MPPFKNKSIKSDKNFWIDEENESRSYLRLLNGLTFLGDLSSAYSITGSNEYVQKGYELIYRWFNENKIEEKINTMAYHDETTALRLEYLVSFIINCKDALEEDKLMFILEKANETVDILIKDSFHTKNTNHGMLQDISILKWVLFLGKDTDKYYYKEIAKKRLNDYFNFVYTSETIAKEHSPVYHLMITANMKKFINILSEFNDNDPLLDEFKLKFRRAEEYILYITRPDGKLPNISDTELTDLSKAYPSIFSSQEYKYIISKGGEGAHPINKNRVFKESGYAIFRDNWGINANQVIFTAAYHSEFHKHSDDLNVLFYSGEDILVESGANGYNYKDKFTKYAYSVNAHNTLSVLNKSLPRHDGKFDKVKLIDYKIGDMYSEAIGENRRYDGVIHRRNVKFYNKTKILEIDDDIISHEENIYELNWHFARGIRLVKDNNIIKLLKGNEELGIVNISSDSKYTINICNGKEEGRVQGWYFNKMENKQKIYNLSVGYTGKNFKINTQIILFKNVKEKSFKKNKELTKVLRDEPIRFKYKIDNNLSKLRIEIQNYKENCKYAYYVFREEECVHKTTYSRKSNFEYNIEKNNKYRIRIFIKLPEEKIISRYTEFYEIK